MTRTPHVLVERTVPDAHSLPEWMLPWPSAGRFRCVTPFSDLDGPFVVRVHAVRAKLAVGSVVADCMAVAEGGWWKENVVRWVFFFMRHARFVKM